jgi:CheY-like chemotaxis protein
MVRFVTLALEGEPSDDWDRQNGYRLTTAFTGAEAKAQLQQTPPDAILLDLGLPDISGWEILSWLRQKSNLEGIPVIIITANDLPQIYQANQQESVHVLLNRPFSRQELSAVLQSLLNTLQPSYPTPATTVEPGHPITVFG